MEANNEKQKEMMPWSEVFQRWTQHSSIHSGRVNVIALVEIATLAGWHVACNDGHRLTALGALVVGTFVGIIFYWLVEKGMGAAEVWLSRYQEKFSIQKLPGMLRQRYLIRALAGVLGALNLILIGLTIKGECPGLLV